MDDDFFADLLGSTGIKPVSKPAPTTPPTQTSSLPSVRTQENNGTYKHSDSRQDAFSQSEPEHQGTSSDRKEPHISISKDELEQLIKTSVSGAMDASFGKFVKSLRTVLEDMSKRIEGTGQACEQLKTQFEELRDVYDSQSQNFHARFSQVDLAIKDVERGVQSLRDKHELAEAQAMLAKLAHDQAEVKPKCLPAPEPVTSPTAAAAPALSTASSASAPVQQAPAAPHAPAAPQMPPPQQQPYTPTSAPQMQHGPQMPQAPQQQPQHHMAPAAPEQHPPQQQYNAPPPQGQYNQYHPPASSAPETYGSAPPAAPPQQQPPTPSHAPYAPPPPQQYQQPPPMAPPMQAPPSGPPQPPPMQGPPPPAGMAPPMPMPMPMPPPAPPMPMAPTPQQGPAYPPPMTYPPAQGQPMYPQAPPPPFRAPSGPPPPMGGPGGPQTRTQTRTVPLDQIINDIAHMGFERHQVMAVVNQLQQQGQSVDLNVILDRLTNGRF